MPKYALPEDTLKEPPMLKYAVPPYYQDYNINNIPALKYAVPHFPQTDNNGIYVKPEINVNEYGIPKFMNNAINRYKNYNDTLDYIENMKKDKRILVIEPSKYIKVKRIERNKDKVKSMYELGYDDAKNMYKDINTFLGEK